jgi:hypothetical protein
MSDTRKATNLLLRAIEDGLLDRDTVIMACVKYMSEDDVRDMCLCNEFLSYEELDGEDDSDED